MIKKKKYRIKKTLKKQEIKKEKNGKIIYKNQPFYCMLHQR